MPLRHEARWNDWRLDQLLQSATFPVYGLLGTPFGLILSGLGISGAPAEYFSLELNFGIPGESDDRRGVSLSSSSLSEWSLPPSLDWRILPSTTPVFDADGKQFERFATLEAVRTSWTTNGPVLVEHCSIAGQPFWGSVQLWTRPALEWHVRFQSEVGPAQLWGVGSGLSKEHLFTLLDQLVIINQRAELVAQYQAEFESWRRPA